MRRFVVAVVVVLLLAACGAGSSSRSRTIVLDRSIGPVTLLERLDKVERALGKGQTLHNNEHYGHYVRYASVALDVAYAPGRHGEVAFAILTTSSRYRTRDGVGVGSSLRQVRAIKGIECFNGGLDCQHGNTHNKPGTGFAFRNGKVWRVVITILD